jgi:hypothetical protein
VAVPDGLLAPRMFGDAADGQVNFDEAAGILVHPFYFSL